MVGTIGRGRRLKDGEILLPAEQDCVAQRRRLAFAGVVSIAIALTPKGEMAGDPDVMIAGLPERTRDGAALRRDHRRGDLRDLRGPSRPASAATRISFRARSSGRAQRRQRRLGQEAPGACAGGGGLSGRPPLGTASGASMIGRLNHVAIAVPDLDKAARIYRETLGARVSAPTTQPDHGVTVVFVELPNTKIELLHPLGRRLADRQVPRAQSGRGHAPPLLRGRRHHRRPRQAEGRKARGCSATASRRSARTASRCCSCIRRTSSARWSRSSRSDAWTNPPARAA